MDQNETIQKINTTLNNLKIHVGDIDSDDLLDLEEFSYGTNVSLIDTDCENLNDAFEIKYGTDPFDGDSDDDGFYDGIEVQSVPIRLIPTTILPRQP